MRYLLRLLVKEKAVLLLLVTLLAICIVNTLHFSYPDEFDNILGGKFIIHGILPYTGFFTHHGPVAYFYSAILYLISGTSFVHFRIVLAISYFLLLVGGYLFMRKKLGFGPGRLFLTFSLVITIGATYFWGHMLLADSLAGYLLTPAYIFLFWSCFNNRDLKRSELVVVSTLVALSLLTSVTYIYAVAILYLLIAYLIFLKNKVKLLSQDSLVISLIILGPYLLFLTYLLISGSLYDFYYQSIYFNQQYYVTAPDGKPISNPLRFAIQIFVTFLDRYRALLVMVKDFNLSNPFSTALVVFNTALLTFVFLKKRFMLGLFIIAFMIYLTARADPLANQDTNYQNIPYDFFSLYNGILVLYLIWTELRGNLDGGRRVINSALLLIVALFQLYLSLFLFNQGFEKAFKKYMGEQSLIYDRPKLSATLNDLIDKNEFYYIGPFAFEEHFYMKGKIASRYFITIPAMLGSDKIKGELIADIERNQPQVIVFNTDGLVLGTHPAPYFSDFLKRDYFTVDDLNYEDDGKKYTILPKDFGEYDFARHFFFRKSNKEVWIKKLQEHNLISEAAAKS